MESGDVVADPWIERRVRGMSLRSPWMPSQRRRSRDGISGCRGSAGGYLRPGLAEEPAEAGVGPEGLEPGEAEPARGLESEVPGPIRVDERGRAVADQGVDEGGFKRHLAATGSETESLLDLGHGLARFSELCEGLGAVGQALPLLGGRVF